MGVKLLINSILIALLALPPFFGGGRTYFVSGLFLISASLLLIFFRRLLADLKNPFEKSNWSARAPLLFYLIFLSLILITLFFSKSPYQSVITYFFFLAYGVLFLVSSQAKFSLKEINLFVWLILSTAALLCLIGVYFYLFGQYTRLTSTFYWPNPFAGYLLMILPLGLGLFLKSQRSGEWFLSGSLAVLLFSSFVLTESRAAYLSLFIPLLIVFWILGRENKKETLVKALILAVSVFVLVTIIFSAKIENFSWFFLSKAQLAQVDSPDVSFFSRTEYWKGAFSIFRDYPWTGAGLNTFGIIYPLYQKIPLAFSVYVHNYYLQMIAEIGILGACFFFLFIVALLWVGLKIIKSAKYELTERKFYALLFFCGILGSMIHSGADFDWYFLANAINFWIMAGWVYGTSLKL